MFRNIYGLDLGTYEIKVFDKKRDYIWKEKNVIARKDKDFLYAAGDEAWIMFEKAPENIEVLFPMQGGAIAKFNDMQCLLESLLKKERLFYGGAEYLVAVPTDVTEVEKRAFYDLVYHYGILKCGKERFASLSPDDYITYRDTKLSMECLVRDKEAARRSYPDVIVDNASLEDIMLFYIKGGVPCED